MRHNGQNGRRTPQRSDDEVRPHAPSGPRRAAERARARRRAPRRAPRFARRPSASARERVREKKKGSARERARARAAFDPPQASVASRRASPSPLRRACVEITTLALAPRARRSPSSRHRVVGALVVVSRRRCSSPSRRPRWRARRRLSPTAPLARPPSRLARRGRPLPPTVVTTRSVRSHPRERGLSAIHPSTAARVVTTAVARLARRHHPKGARARSARRSRSDGGYS